MASRRRKQDKNDPIDTTNVHTGDVTEAILPGAVPTDEDGGVAGGGDGVELDEATIRKIGAIDADSSRRNKTMAEVQVRRKTGEKNVRWNDTNGLAKYDSILQIWSSQGLLAYISRTEPSPSVDYPPMQCAAIRNGQQLYDAILRNCHRTSGAATYLVRVREGTLDRGTFTISMPDTMPLQPPQSQMQPPWMVQQPPPAPYGYPAPYGPPGYPPPPYPAPGYPPGYPALPPAYDPYAQAHPQPPQQPPQQQQPPQTPQQPPPQTPPAAAASAAPAPATPPPAPQTPPQYAQPPQQNGFAQPYGYGQPMGMQPYSPPAPPPPAPPPSVDPSTQAWMGAMYEKIIGLQQKLDQATTGSQRTEMERLFAMIEEIKRGSSNAPSIQQLQAQIEMLSRQPPPPPAPALAPAAQPPPGFLGGPGPGFGGAPPGFGGPLGMPNPYAALGGLPRPPGYPEHLPWPPNPWANPWGIQAPPPQQQVAPPPPPPPPPPEPVDPLQQVRGAVEMVGTLATLMDRVRGVAPAVSEQTATAAPIVPARPNTIETMKVGDVDVAIRPDTGDISWVHTMMGLAPKAFEFLGKFSSEAAKTIRSHDAAQAVQSGRMPVQYIPMQPQPQYQPPPQWPPQQPAFQPPPQHLQPPAPATYVPPPVQRAPAQPPAAPAPLPPPAPAAAAPAAPAPPASTPPPAASSFVPSAASTASSPPPVNLNGAAPAAPATEPGIKSLFG